MTEFRPMRRNRQQLSREECERTLDRCTSGVLALAGDSGYPYAVPLSYVYADGAIIFHSAVEGHKVDAIKRDNRCSFCVIEQDEIKPAEFTTYFRSVIAFGRIHILETADESKPCASWAADTHLVTNPASSTRLTNPWTTSCSSASTSTTCPANKPSNCCELDSTDCHILPMLARPSPSRGAARSVCVFC